VARLTRRRTTNDAEFAIMIRDDCQRQGIGTTLMSKLIEVARAEQIERLVGEILPENEAMKRLAEKVGFHLTYEIEEGVTRAELALS
jgi:acetyltransferase